MGRIDVKNFKLTENQEEIYMEAMVSIARHNQAAIHLVTSGGKSYILAKIIYTLKKESKRKKFNVLYISTASSCTNFLQCMSDDYWGDTISVVNYTQLQRDEKYVDKLNKKRFDIIVIDEAHHALAKKTYEGIVYTENKYADATIIAMSANNRRYDDRKWVFDWLTPKLTLGVDYQNRGLKYAVANDQICNFEYKSCDIARLKRYCTIFDKLQERGKIYLNVQETITRAKELIEQYKVNSFSKLQEQIHSDLKELHIDGSQGDRWFVFFNTIAELKESIDSVRNLFINAYGNKELNIVIHEYHGKNSNVDESTQVLTGEATPGTVDIIMTCLKGGESFHPENTRGIIMNRKSGSENVIVQELGRALQVKELCDECKLIYDLVGNNETLDITQTIFNGTDTPDERDIISALNMDSSTDKLMESLENTYGDNGQYSSIEDLELDDLLSEFEDYKDKVEHLLYAQIIASIIKEYKDEHPDSPNIHPIMILKEYDRLNGTSKNKYSMTDAFCAIQKLFIQGYFGEYTMDNVNVGSDFYTIYSLLGDYLYMTPRCSDNATWEDDKYSVVPYIKLSELIEVADGVKKYNYEYYRISHTKELNSKINRLRQLNLEGRLSESYQKYCKRNKIDIDGSYCNIISIVLKSDDAQRLEHITQQFKSIIRKLNIIENKMTTEEWCLDDNIDLLLDTFGDQQIFNERYACNDFGKQCIIALKIRYKKVLSLKRKLIDKNDMINTVKDIRAIIKIQSIINSESNGYIGGDYELAIMSLSKRNENNNLGEFEQVVLDKLKITEYEGKRDSRIKKLLDYTEFGILYKKLVDTNSESAYNRLMQYDKNNIPEYCKKLLNTKKFKQSIDNIKQSQLLLKDNTEIKNIVSELIFADEEQIDRLRALVESIEFDTRNLLKYAIPEIVYSRNKVYFDKVIANDWNSVDENTHIVIRNILSKDSSCMGVIVNNLMSANLIPDIQKRFANIIMENKG
jgi:superfamily II DNA or RNA helicase